MAQENSVNEGIPRLIFTDIKWSHKEDWKITGAETYGTGDQMKPSTMTVQKRNYFIYQTLIKNETGRNLKAFNYDLVFLKKTDGNEAGRLKFSYFRLLKKNKKIKSESYGGPPTKLVNALDPNNNDPINSLTVTVEIKCIMFEDNKIWQSKKLADDGCDELKLFILKREKEQSKFRF